MNLLNISSLLFYLLPVALLTGPFIPDLIVSLLSIVFLLVLTNKKNLFYLKNNFFYLFIFFYAILIISSLNSEFIFFSLKSSLPYIRFILFSLAVWYILRENKNAVKIFTFSLIVSFIFALCDGYFQFWTGESFFGFDGLNELRLNLPFNDRMLLGAYLSRLLPLVIALSILIFDKRKYMTYLSASFLLISSDILIYLSGERTAMGIAIISVIFILIFLKKYRFIRIVTILISISIISAITIFSPDVKSRNINLTVEQMGLSEESERLVIFSMEHEKLYLNAYNIFKENKILGAGPNTFRKNCSSDENNYGCSTHPHSIYLQIISEIGIVGFIYVALIILYFVTILSRHLFLIFKNKDSEINDVQILLIACFFCTLWPLLPSLNFFNNWINIIYYLPVGFYLNIIYGNKVQTNKS